MGITRQDIEEAIQVFHDRPIPYDHEVTLANVAEAWLKLEEWLGLNRNGYDAETLDCKKGRLLQSVLNTMHVLLTPTPKTDLQRVREAIEMQPWGYQIYRKDLLRLLDQLEAEKEKP